MKTILILVYHGIGHFNACFAIARSLTGYRVVFAGMALFKEYVEGQGIEYRSLSTVPFGLGLEGWVNKIEGKQPVYLHSLRDRWRGKLYSLRETELIGLINQVKPDFILIDYLQSTDFIVLFPIAKERRIRIGFLQTMFPQSIRNGFPPINSLALPDDRRGMEQSIRRIKTLRFMKNATLWLIFFGRNNPAMVRSRMKQNGISAKYNSNQTTPFSIPFEHVDEFVLSPREFDFPNPRRPPREHYVGFLTDTHRVEKQDEEYQSLIQRLKSNTYPLIYCSFGTVEPDWARAVDIFLNRLIRVIEGKPLFLVISMPGSRQVMDDISFPENIWCLNSAPQLDLLSRAALFITHGGLNSIKESVYAGVPMLVYPVNSTLDQRGNSSRVVYHKLGSRGKLSDSIQTMERKINELLTDPMYKENLDKLKQADLRYSIEGLRGKIEGMNYLD